MQQAELKRIALDLGADLVGFCQLPNPTLGFSYAISIAVKLSDAVLSTVEDAPSFVYFQHYRTANALLDNIAFRLTQTLERAGYSALPVAASQSLGKANPYYGVIPHKSDTRSSFHMTIKASLGSVSPVERLRITAVEA